MLLLSPRVFHLRGEIASCKHLACTAFGSRRHLGRPLPFVAVAAASTKTISFRQAGPLKKYRELVDSGQLHKDEHQESIIKLLQKLHDQLKDYHPPTTHREASQKGIFYRLLHGTPSTPSEVEHAPKGLYLYGSVGTGKTMLMDLFYDTIPRNITRRRRVHFHAFMIDVHKRLHQVKMRGGSAAVADPIPPVAAELADEAVVLCFDEFQVTDIADAMILRRLLEMLESYGVVIVTTSNRHPKELYLNGIQRQSFVPAIELLMKRNIVQNLDGGTDYRRMLGGQALSKVYFDPIDQSTRNEMQKIWEAHQNEAPAESQNLQVWGRTLKVPLASSDGKAAKFTFQELCGQPLSAADYIELVKSFAVIFVTDIPKMTLSEKDLARRFITFIDACYEGKTKLVTSSDVPLFHVLLSGGDQSGSQTGSATPKGLRKAAESLKDTIGSTRASLGKRSDRTPDHEALSRSANKEEQQEAYTAHMRSAMDDLGMNIDEALSNPIFSGEEEKFASLRAVSRLIEMSGKRWVGEKF